jgi:hypothetical protein
MIIAFTINRIRFHAVLMELEQKLQAVSNFHSVKPADQFGTYFVQTLFTINLTPALPSTRVICAFFG